MLGVEQEHDEAISICALQYPVSPFVLSLSKDERTPLAIRQAQGELVAMQACRLLRHHCQSPLTLQTTCKDNSEVVQQSPKFLCLILIFNYNFKTTPYHIANKTVT
jgi:hypothetical protein